MLEGTAPWRRWGPYLAERAWGTVREDYSPDGDAWNWFPHDDARSRTYRWNEDGMGAICDERQFLCLGVTLWNGVDPIMKERMFGLSGPEGNHGEDVKEYWYFLDSTPTHSWMRWRYLYPQVPFPYEDLRATNQKRTRLDPEYELLDTGAFASGCWEVTADFAKADPEDMCIAIRAVNLSPNPATLHVVPNLWLRNTWAWGRDDRRANVRLGEAGLIRVQGHSYLGERVLAANGSRMNLFCENESNAARLWHDEESPAFPKDGIHDHIVSGAATCNPALVGTKAGLWYQEEVAAGATMEVRLRLAPWTGKAPDVGSDWEKVMSDREAEAEEYHAALSARAVRPMDSEASFILRQAAAGMLWGKQFFHYDVADWLDGDPALPPPPPGRGLIRNGTWRHLSNADVISMPDVWEYPWYASWDLAFHCISLAYLDPGFAKQQLVLLCREWFMHPNGQLPAYEWNFGDVNPPLLAYAALRVFFIDGRKDYDFLERVLHKLSINFTWWVNREDPMGNNMFEGGFLGLDNIAPFDRSKLPPGSGLAQSDGTAWMAFYALTLLGLSIELALNDSTYEDLATKYFEHYTYIAVALNGQGFWDEEDGFFYDVLYRPDGSSEQIRVRSVVGLIPVFAVGVLEPEVLDRLPHFAERMDWFETHRPQYRQACAHTVLPGHQDRRLLSVVPPDRLIRIMERVLDTGELLSAHGIRSVSRWHLEHPYQVTVDNMQFQVDYEPAESTTALFGGNSNWRGPIWFPINHMLVASLHAYHKYYGDKVTVEHPTGSGHQMTLAEVADDLTDRLVSLFREDAEGHRPVHGGNATFDTDPHWHDLLPFHEYFHGDTGKGLGASHQTGWTGLIVDLLLGGSAPIPPGPQD